jgi:hypothetical protein
MSIQLQEPIQVQDTDTGIGKDAGSVQVQAVVQFLLIFRVCSWKKYVCSEKWRGFT